MRAQLKQELLMSVIVVLFLVSVAGTSDQKRMAALEFRNPAALKAQE
jgi:hypothetical protein